MKIRNEHIEESIFRMIAEIENLKSRIANTFSTSTGITSLTNYYYIKVGMCLSLIDTYRSTYSPTVDILQWYNNHIEIYIRLKKFIYEE